MGTKYEWTSQPGRTPVRAWPPYWTLRTSPNPILPPATTTCRLLEPRSLSYLERGNRQQPPLSECSGRAMHQLPLAVRPPALRSHCSGSRTACRCSLKQAPASLAVAARRCAAAPLLAASLLLAAAASPGIPAGTPPGLPRLPLVSRDACSRLRSSACTVHTRCGKIYGENFACRSTTWHSSVSFIFGQRLLNPKVPRCSGRRASGATTREGTSYSR